MRNLSSGFPTQTGLYNHRIWLENLGSSGIVLCSENIVTVAVNAQLICAFAFRICKNQGFSLSESEMVCLHV